MLFIFFFHSIKFFFSLFNIFPICINWFLSHCILQFPFSLYSIYRVLLCFFFVSFWRRVGDDASGATSSRLPDTMQPYRRRHAVACLIAWGRARLIERLTPRKASITFYKLLFLLHLYVFLPFLSPSNCSFTRSTIIDSVLIAAPLYCFSKVDRNN